MTKQDTKITIISIKFSMNACKNLTKAEIDNLSDTVTDYFHFSSLIFCK